MTRYSLCMGSAFFLVVAALPAEDDDGDKAKLKGTWNIVSFEIDGKKQRTDEELKKFLVTIDADGKITVDLDGKTIVESTSKIDPTKTPKTLDQTFTKGGGGAGKTSLWIYELKDDTLKICATAPGDPRQREHAASLETPEGQVRLSVALFRKEI